jgi:dihydrofolate synthase/folylpolyglutamate synthase
MNYQQSIDYLYNTLPMFSRVGAAAIKKDITNTKKICAALNNPQTKFKTIHVAGTNGKGSVSHMLAAILQTAGYTVGLYTSPHLKDFRERIKVNGAMCEENFVIEFVEKIQPLISSIQPSFFELTVAMAFEYFVQQKVEVAVIETGLGGRLDSTNIVAPELSVITNIGWDHMNILGDSLEKIAVEKAGIIKQNVPVVIGEYLPATKLVFEKEAQQKHAPIYFAQERNRITHYKYHPHQLSVEVATQEQDEKETYHLDLTGIYQTKNLITVLEAAHRLHLKGWRTQRAIIKKALTQVKKLTGLHGRWEILEHHPTVVADVAHNVDGMQQLLAQINISTYNQLHIIVGMVKDKEVESVLKLLPQPAKYYFTQSHIPRALTADNLQQKATVFNLKGDVFDNVNTALQKAKQQAGANDLIIICGSVFLVGEVEMIE